MTNSIPPGIYAAVLTPLHENLRINHEELAWHCQDLIQRGCQGIALFGTTGEGPSFSVSERLEALEKLVSKGFNPKQIILGNGSSGIADTTALSLMAAKLGLAAILISPPSYYKNIKEEGAIAYYRAIIQRAAHPNLRAVLYHIPQMSGVPITLSIIKALRREFPHTVIGIKESEGNLAFTKSILAECAGFQVFVGKELHIPEATEHGGSGSICGIANLYPELIRKLYEEPKSPSIQTLEAISQIFKGTAFIPAIKSLMETRRGEAWHTVYPPLTAYSTTEAQDLLTSLRDARVFNVGALPQTPPKD